MSRHSVRDRIWGHYLTGDPGRPSRLDVWGDNLYRRHPALSTAAGVACMVVFGLELAWILAGW